MNTSDSVTLTNPVFDHGKSYRPLSQHYREHFGEKVFKVSVSIADRCPNRAGRNGARICSFCDEWGSAAYHQFKELSLEEQIQINREAIRRRYRARKFLVYFQAYTNTLEKAAKMKKWYDVALRQTDIVGIVVGTRPDCLPRRVLNLFAEIAEHHYLSVEIGAQSFNDEQLNFLSRGHNSACSVKAIKKLKKTPGVNVCVHLMFGLPEETEAQLRHTAQLLSGLGVDGVKLHNLHVLRATPLAEEYASGRFVPVTLEEYARKVSLFLEHLSPNIAIHRLAAVANRWDELIAPDWTREKMKTQQFIEDFLDSHNCVQGGKLCSRNSANFILNHAETAASSTLQLGVSV